MANEKIKIMVNDTELVSVENSKITVDLKHLHHSITPLSVLLEYLTEMARVLVNQP